MNYTISRIEVAQVCPTPFPHIYVSDVVEDGIYDRLVSSLNDGEYQTLDGLRHSRELDNWARDLFLSPEIRESLCRKFDCSGSTSSAVLVRDKKGFSIAPHADAPGKVVTALFYLPKNDLEDSGTEFYANGEVVNKFPFKRNSMLAFKVGPSSFHGLASFNHDTPRDLLLYYVSKP